MEMEVMPAMDFNFDSNCSSPYMTAPSSPQRFGNSFFFSAPASPTRISAFYQSTSSKVFQVSDSDDGKSHKNDDDDEEDEEENNFEFNFSGQLERVSLSAADELFDGGKIRPLKPSTGYDSESAPSTVSSPFEQRSRERVSESSSRKGTRSLSPIRVSDILHEQVDNSQASRSTTTTNNNNNNSKSYASSILSAISFSNKKWKLKDFLFRSASEGRATSPDPLSKFAVLSKKETVDDDVKNSSFRSTESSGSISRRRRSAHELHYTANRAVSEELKKKTFLPYKQGLLGGCLRFNPSGVNDISRGFGSLTRG